MHLRIIILIVLSVIGSSIVYAEDDLVYATFIRSGDKEQVLKIYSRGVIEYASDGETNVYKWVESYKNITAKESRIERGKR